MSKLEYKDIIAFHPGYYIKEMIEESSMTQDELAKRLNVSGKHVSELVNGISDMNEDMALRLSIVFGTTADLWLQLNQTYLRKKIIIKEKIQEDEQKEYFRQIDYRFWVDLGLVKNSNDTNEKIKELQRYLKISSLGALARRDFLIQYRSVSKDIQEKNIINSNAWVQTALNIGSCIDVEPFDMKLFKDSIAKIREMTEYDPSVFLPKMKAILSECGVVLVILPHLKNSGVNGAVKWIRKDKVILAINDRNKYADIFWFSLFHEFGHILQKRIAMLIVSGNDNELIGKNDLINTLEAEADSFAKNALIPEKEYSIFISSNNYSAQAIERFAKEINIQFGIVLGRLQKDEYVGYKTKMNSLKKKYCIV